MNNRPQPILEYAEAKPEATPIQAKNLLHLGDPAAVARALSRLVRWGRFLRICGRVRIRPIQIRFGLRTPSLAPTITALGGLGGETIVSNGRDVSNWLGRTTENAVRPVYGPDRLLHFGAHQVELLHAPCWQLAAPHGTAGTVIRAISWLGPSEGKRIPDAGLPKFALRSRSLSTPDSRALSADPPKSESRRWR